MMSSRSFIHHFEIPNAFSDPVLLSIIVRRTESAMPSGQRIVDGSKPIPHRLVAIAQGLRGGADAAMIGHRLQHGNAVTSNRQPPAAAQEEQRVSRGSSTGSISIAMNFAYRSPRACATADDIRDRGHSRSRALIAKGQLAGSDLRWGNVNVTVGARPWRVLRGCV